MKSLPEAELAAADERLTRNAERSGGSSPSWRDAEGNELVGVVKELGEVQPKDERQPRYPVLTLVNVGRSPVPASEKVEDGKRVDVDVPVGEDVAVHANRDVLRGELAKLAPSVGETIAVRSLGKQQGKVHEYHDYSVVELARHPEADELATFVADGFDWGHYRSGNGKPVSVNAPLDAPADAGDTSDDDEIPF